MPPQIKLCECGCGTPTKPAKVTCASKGWIKGEPLRFAARGHNAKVTNHPHRRISERDWREEDRGYLSPCWIWQDKRDESRDRYPHRLVMINKKRIPAHVAVYELFVGPVPRGHHLHHRCEQPACVNPEHLTPLLPGDHARIHTARLTAEDVRRIRRKEEDPTILATELAITRRHLLSIRRGRGWSGVTP